MCTKKPEILNHISGFLYAIDIWPVSNIFRSHVPNCYVAWIMSLRHTQILFYKYVYAFTSDFFDVAVLASSSNSSSALSSSFSTD